MPNEQPALTGSCGEEVVEVFKLQLKPAALEVFLAKGQGVHQFFSRFEGYTGLDILLLTETQILVLVRWANHRLFDQHLPYILNGCPVSDWFGSAETIGHQPAILTSMINPV